MTHFFVILILAYRWIRDRFGSLEAPASELANQSATAGGAGDFPVAPVYKTARLFETLPIAENVTLTVAFYANGDAFGYIKYLKSGSTRFARFDLGEKAGARDTVIEQFKALAQSKLALLAA